MRANDVHDETSGLRRAANSFVALAAIGLLTATTSAISAGEDFKTDPDEPKKIELKTIAKIDDESVIVKGIPSNGQSIVIRQGKAGRAQLAEEAAPAIVEEKIDEKTVVEEVIDEKKAGEKSGDGQSETRPTVRVRVTGRPIAGTAAARADEKRKEVEVARVDSLDGSKVAATNSAGVETFLGVSTEPAPELLSKHFPGVIPKGTGLIIQSVLKDSPAEKAGLKVDDILIGMEGKPLSDPMRFKKMIVALKPESTVRIELVREGKKELISVKLIARKVEAEAIVNALNRGGGKSAELAEMAKTKRQAVAETLNKAAGEAPSKAASGAEDASKRPNQPKEKELAEIKSQIEARQAALRFKQAQLHADRESRQMEIDAKVKRLEAEVDRRRRLFERQAKEMEEAKKKLEVQHVELSNQRRDLERLKSGGEGLSGIDAELSKLRAEADRLAKQLNDEMNARKRSKAQGDKPESIGDLIRNEVDQAQRRAIEHLRKSADHEVATIESRLSAQQAMQAEIDAKRKSLDLLLAKRTELDEKLSKLDGVDGDQFKKTADAVQLEVREVIRKLESEGKFQEASEKLRDEMRKSIRLLEADRAKLYLELQNRKNQSVESAKKSKLEAVKSSTASVTIRSETVDGKTKTTVDIKAPGGKSYRDTFEGTIEEVKKKLNQLPEEFRELLKNVRLSAVEDGDAGSVSIRVKNLDPAKTGDNSRVIELIKNGNPSIRRELFVFDVSDRLKEIAPEIDQTVREALSDLTGELSTELIDEIIGTVKRSAELKTKSEVKRSQ